MSIHARINATRDAQRAIDIYNASGTQAVIAKRFGVSLPTVAAIKTGETWSDFTGAVRPRDRTHATPLSVRRYDRAYACNHRIPSLSDALPVKERLAITIAEFFR